jgi:hypothetical protein
LRSDEESCHVFQKAIEKAASGLVNMHSPSPLPTDNSPSPAHLHAVSHIPESGFGYPDLTLSSIWLSSPFRFALFDLHLPIRVSDLENGFIRTSHPNR